MFVNYIKTALRNLSRNRLYSFINIAGLAVGIAACLMIYLWVQDELSYDRFHEKAARIHRVERKVDFRDIHGQAPITSGPYGPALVRDYPEIENFVRLDRDEASVKDLRNIFRRQSLIFADSSIFEVFDFHLESGNPATALTQPQSIVLTPASARRFLGTDDVLGRSLTLDWNGVVTDFQITGILAEVPPNSHVRFEMLASIASYPEEDMTQWFSNFIYTYVLVRQGSSGKEVEKKLPAFLTKYMGADFTAFVGPESDINDVFQLKMKPLLDIHLYPSEQFEIESQGSMDSVVIFSAIAFLILVIACINFMNLSTARAHKRAREVGMRKAVGALKQQLRTQFLGESVLLSLLALILAVALIALSIPVFNAISGKALSLELLLEPANGATLFGIALLTGILSGLYPAMYLAAFSPVRVLKGTALSGKGKSVFRKTMSVLQFAISIILIIGTLIIYSQMRFIQNKSLGFDKENVVLITSESDEVGKNIEVLRSLLLENVGIKSVAASSNIPGSATFSDTVFKRDDSDEIFSLTFLRTDFDFVDTYGFDVIAGRRFSKDFTTDQLGALMINAAGVEEIGYSPQEAVGRKLLMAVSAQEFREFTIVGVIQDFHFKSLHRIIEPCVLLLAPEAIRFVSVRILPGDIMEILGFIREKWMEVFPGEEFEYSFLDDRINRLYASENRIRKIFLIFAALSISVACLGLFGLAAFTAAERTKEIGVRKVLGASEVSILVLFVKEFSKWVLAANIIAWPVAYYAMYQWMQGFAYRAKIGPGAFLLSAVLALLIALVTVSYQSVRAALSDPVRSLRYE